MHDLDLPRGEERELVVVREHVHELDGDHSWTLAAVGAFRAVPERALDIDHDTLEYRCGGVIALRIPLPRPDYPSRRTLDRGGPHPSPQVRTPPSLEETDEPHTHIQQR